LLKRLRRSDDHRSHDVRVDDPATDRNGFSTMFGYSGFHGDPA
jgi:hypothetical protein